MKILMIAPTPFFADRGCHVRIYEEARALVRRGHAVTLCTYHHGRDLPGPEIRRTPRIPWYQKLGAGPSYHKFYVDLLLLQKALAAGWRMRPDVLHAHLHEGAALGLLLRPLLRTPVVLDYQGSLSRELVDHDFVPEASARMRLYATVEGTIERRADAVVVSATNSLAPVRENRGSANGAYVVTDAVDTTPPAAADALSQARARWRIPAGRPLVVFMGLLNRYQGLDHLFEAIPQVLARAPQVHFLIIGFPEEEYRRRAETSGMAASITFTGKVPYEETPALLALADVAVSPKVSLSEANLKLYSYMGAGLPTVVFDNPVNREVLGDLGAYAPLGDARAFAEQILALLAEPERRVRIGSELRARAAAERSWDRQAERLEEIYRAAAEHYRRSRSAS